MNDIPGSSHDDALMRHVLSRIATGPELSKDISRAEARDAMRLVLDNKTDPVRAGVFLIALRMKRETDDETLGVLDALREATTIATAPVEGLVDIADPYDGFLRSLPAGPFLPAVLAACGVPAVSHGVASMGPKYGVTHRQVLHAAGIRADLTLEEACARIADPAISWAYVDQAMFCPKLYALRELRDLIVKRPVLTTLDTILGPIRGRRKTVLYTGYVHKNYPRIYALAARASGFDSAIIVRGVEGGVVPSLRQEGKMYGYRDGGTEQEQALSPAAFGFAAGFTPPAPSGAADATALATAAAEEGARALAGEPGTMRDCLVAAGALALWHVDRSPSLNDAANSIRAVLDNGSARARFL